MRSSSTATFRKLSTCPAAETLLSFTRGRRGPTGRDQATANHLAACDFCAAEAQLLARLPARDEPPRRAPAEIPAHLRLLAESLLTRPSEDRARSAEPLHEVGRLTLTDA
ncbi:MAG TPA: hypothetical protein VEY09_03140 [Pyrinomonadaceae bacterium]|nr:hypothetical protein [Pyrinomonadaceae bacterium]